MYDTGAITWISPEVSNSEISEVTYFHCANMRDIGLFMMTSMFRIFFCNTVLWDTMPRG